MSGWIKLHRQIMENPLYFSEPFSRTQAWIDLLLLANHKENYFFKRGIRVDVSIGQVGYDIDSLGKRWQWSRGKVERFILHLEKEGNVVRQKNNVSTLISITKYKEYQADSKPKDKPNGQQIGIQTDTNNNDNNDNNEKNIENRKLKFADTLKPFLGKYGSEMLNEFYVYWTEPNKSNTKFRQELEKTWSLEGRLSTWAKNDSNFNKQKPSKPEQNLGRAYTNEIKL
jgi:hypothetical protein